MRRSSIGARRSGAQRSSRSPPSDQPPEACECALEDHPHAPMCCKVPAGGATLLDPRTTERRIE